MKPYNLDFCERFGYPFQIREHFTQILDQIRRRLGEDNVMLVVLFGSTSRGELTYETTSNSHIELFSDYEFLIVTDGNISQSDLADLTQDFSENKARWEITNPLFHIEFMHNTPSKLRLKRHLVRNIPSFEIYETGLVIFGEDGVWNRYIAKITPKDINLGATNELIIERLWRQLEWVWEPESIHTGQIRSDRTTYFTARNALDILTIFLPNTGTLIPGYRRRHEYFIEHCEVNQLLPPSLGPFLQECLDAKQKLQISKPLHYYYEGMLIGYASLLKWLIYGEKVESLSLDQLPDLCQELIARKHSVFAEHFLWRGIRVVREFKIARSLEIPRPIGWAVAEKRYSVLVLLLYIHWWILGNLRSDSSPQIYLGEAQKMLARIGHFSAENVQDWAGVTEQCKAILESWRRRP